MSDHGRISPEPAPKPFAPGETVWVRATFVRMGRQGQALILTKHSSEWVPLADVRRGES